MWFKKKKEYKDGVEDRIRTLERDIEVIDDYFRKMKDELNEQIDKLNRVIKFSKEDEPNYELKLENRKNNVLFTIPVVRLFLYIDKEEYTFVLEELTYNRVDESSISLFVKNGIAYFAVETTPFTKKEVQYRTEHTFTIEYKTGRYVHEERTYEVSEDE